MTFEEAKNIFLNRGYIEVPGGTYYDADKWRNAIVVISKWLEQQPCEDCIHETDHRTDLWELEIQSEQETNGSIFLKTYPDSHLTNIAYDDGVCYIYVDLGGSRTRFTSDWWNTSYKIDKEEK